MFGANGFCIGCRELKNGGWVENGGCCGGVENGCCC